MLTKKEKDFLGLDHDANGVTRQLDKLGRITLPKEYLKQNGYDTGTYFEVLDYGGIFVIKPSRIQNHFTS